jgi:hypothetical protein
MTVKVVPVLAIRIYKQDTELRFKLHDNIFFKYYSAGCATQRSEIFFNVF